MTLQYKNHQPCKTEKLTYIRRLAKNGFSTANTKSFLYVNPCIYLDNNEPFINVSSN